MNAWVIAALAVIGLALLVTAVVLLARSRKSAPKPSSLASIWARFLGDLGGAAARDPVVVVLGERLAGKSTLIQASLAGTARTALSDTRLGCYAGKDLLVQEIAGDLLEGREAESALSDLWRDVGLDAAMVVCVVRTNAASWTPAGLAHLGAMMRSRIDLVTAARGAPPAVRVCLTHVDEGAEGFSEIARLAGKKALSLPAPSSPDTWSAADLRRMLDPLLPYVRSAVANESPAATGRVARFCEVTGPRLVADLPPFLDAIFHASTGATKPLRERVVLGGGAAEVIVGDALTPDASVIDGDTQMQSRRRKVTAILATLAAALLLLALYVAHFFAVDHAEQAVRAFDAATRRAQSEPQKNWSIDGPARDAEAAAADALEAALAPLYPPLRLAYPARKKGLAEVFLDQIRRLYILPATQSSEASRRIYALSLLYATSDDRLGDQVRAAPEAWATALGVPTRVVTDYLARSDRRWQGSVPAPLAGAGEVGMDEWTAWLDAIDGYLRREKVSAEELLDLQNKGARLSASVGGALEVRGLEAVIAELKAVRGDEVDAFVGRGAVRQRAPQWVSENWEKLDAMLGVVQKSSVAVPVATGKSLKKALDDLANVGRAETETGLVYTLVLEGRPPYVFGVDAWSALMRASRGAIYTQAFVDDVRTSGRSPFFTRGVEYPAVGLVPGRGVRGATRSISGFYTAQAVAADVKPALLSLDPTLEGAVVPSQERASMQRLVQGEMARYAASYRAAIWDYITSFRLDVTSVAGLRSDLEDMVGPASWLTEFWRVAAENARVDAQGNVYLEPLAQALASLGAVDAMMTGDKGKYPILEKYYAIVAPLIPALDAGTPAPPGPAGAPLEDRVSKLGKLGLSLLDTDKPAALPDVNAWLDGARLLDRSLRTPFLVQIEVAYEYALQNVEKTFEYAYRADVRPLVATQLGRFPIDPRADTDAGPDELLTAIGPKGTFRTAIDGLLAPLCRKAITTACTLKAPVGFRAVRVNSEATELSSWSWTLAGVLWDDGGKPKTIPFQARPRALPEVRRGDNVVATLSFLRSGTTTVYAFNQVPTWQPLPVAWSTSSVAAVGVERLDPSSTEKLVLTTEGEGSLWRFYRLLCKAERVAEGSATWAFEPPVTFDLQPEPWSLVVPHSQRGKRCPMIVARK